MLDISKAKSILRKIGNQNLQDKELGFIALKSISDSLDITATDHENLKRTYKAVGNFLSGKTGWLSDCYIYAQGSVGLGTVVKPIVEADEIDVDLVLHIPGLKAPISPEDSQELLRDLISVLQCERYIELVEHEPKRRCIRLNFKGSNKKYHMDITPAVPVFGSQAPKDKPVIVPDIIDGYSTSNPGGYRNWFRSISSKSPKWSKRAAFNQEFGKARAEVESYPSQVRKTILQLIVQVLKRHRDIWKNNQDNIAYKSYAPISIVITTLAAKAFDECINNQLEYDSELDLILDVLNLMSEHIQINYRSSGIEYVIKNPSMHCHDGVEEENFADKWNHDSQYFTAFQQWYKNAVIAFATVLQKNQGLDALTQTTKLQFGEACATAVSKKLAEALTRSRVKETVAVKSSGLLTGIANDSASATNIIASCREELRSSPTHNFYNSNFVND